MHAKLHRVVPPDGLVFTPNSMPYVLGLQQHLFKWQPAAQKVGKQTYEFSVKHLNSGS